MSPDHAAAALDVSAPLVGQPIERIEDEPLLRGAGRFVADLRRPGLLHVAVLRSSVAHGRIAAIDTAAACAMPGVHAVLTARDLGGTVPLIPLRLAALASFAPFLQPVIARDKVRYVGEPVAVVVADTQALAEDALELIDLEIEPLAAVTGRAAQPALLFEAAGTNLATCYDVQRGDPEAAFRDAPYTRRECFRAHRHTALPMETRGVLAEWDERAGRLTVWGAAKVPFFNRRTLAGMLGLADAAVDLIEGDTGAGFGVRGEFYPEDFLIPFAARHVNRPVRWIEDRREHLLATNHSREIDCELEIACARDGTILALRGAVFADMGAYIRTNGGVVPAKAAQFLPGPYRIPHVGLHVEALLSNKTPTGTYRAPGRFEANFFRERLLDMAAADLGIDPVEIRRSNLITQEELPYPLGVLVPYEPESAYDTGDYPMALDRCLAEIRWPERSALQGQLIEGRYHGVGLAPFVESGGAGPREHARATVDADGCVTVRVGASVLGQGLATALAQIAADALGLPVARIRVLHGSTTLLAEGFGTYHSRGAVMGGSAVLDACTTLAARVREEAARRLGFPNAEIRLADGEVRAASSALALAEFAGTEADGQFGTAHRTYTYGAHACYVAVDPRTGQVEVLDYVAVEDVGRAINPAIVHGQAIGAIVQGLGGAFLDHLVYDAEGQLLNASLADYLVPLASDFPNVRAVTLEWHRAPSNPLGVKGAGEGGIVAVAAAVGGAIAAALAPLGVEVREMPFSPPRIWQLIADRAGT